MLAHYGVKQLNLLQSNALPPWVTEPDRLACVNDEVIHLCRDKCIFFAVGGRLGIQCQIADESKAIAHFQ